MDECHQNSLCNRFEFTCVPFVSHEIHTTEDPEFKVLHTKNIILNEDIHALMAAQDQPHENFEFLEFLPS